MERPSHETNVYQNTSGFSKRFSKSQTKDENSHRAELNASDAVAQLVQGRRPAHDAHHVGHDQQDPAGDARFSRQTDLEQTNRRSTITSPRCGAAATFGWGDTHMEGELSREVVHAAGVHQTQSVSYRLRAQHTLACDWTETAIGQSGRHDAGALAGHLDGAQLMSKDRNHCHTCFI